MTKITKKFRYHNTDIEISEANLKHQKNKHVIERLSDGSYEKEEISLLLRHLSPKATVLDLGASLGILSCVIGKRLEDSSKMVCVEANPNLIEDLKNNRNINNLKFTVIHGAASSRNFEVEFNFNGLSLSGSIAKKKHLLLNEKAWGEYKSVKLQTITPMDVESQTGLKFNALSCDIEGEELRLLPEMIEYFKNFDVLVVEFHAFAQNSGTYNYTISDIHNMYSKYFQIEKFGNTTCFYKK